MKAKQLLWVDFTQNLTEPSLGGSLPDTYAVKRASYPFDICATVETMLPWALCCEFDHPDTRSLHDLERVKLRFHSLPMLMLTGGDADSLADWEHRFGIWDHLVKPCSVRTLCESLHSLSRGGDHFSSVEEALPAPSEEIESQTAEAARLAPAASFVRENYSDKIPLATAAGMCDLSPFQFSRLFKKVNGVTFRDYVVQLRIQRAAELMKQPRSSVTDAAFGVGFNDLSYFARVFRKRMGVCPSTYRARNEARQIGLFPKA